MRRRQLRRFKFRFSYLAPKIVGVSLVLVATSYAFDSEWPVALGDREVEVPDSASREHSWVESMEEIPCAESPECSELLFVWTAEVVVTSWRLVLLDADRREVAWSRSTTNTSYHPEGEFAEALLRGAGRLWKVVGEREKGQIRSPLRLIGAR